LYILHINYAHGRIAEAALELRRLNIVEDKYSRVETNLTQQLPKCKTENISICPSFTSL
jgi:hypothetical protein